MFRQNKLLHVHQTECSFENISLLRVTLAIFWNSLVIWKHFGSNSQPGLLDFAAGEVAFEKIEIYK